jgi:alginate O-acetyltransferase complex protein AlgI
VTVFLFWISPAKLRTVLLLVASYIFYMSWKPIYGLLMIGLTVINYFFGLAIHKFSAAKKPLMITAVVSNLLVLGYFKYTYYAIELVNQAIAPWGQHLPRFAFEIILPLGISFFAFEFIHYVVEVYKGGKPVRSLPQFALFAGFFPTQLAGPIKRYQDFIPQLSEVHRPGLKEIDDAVWLILFGLFKKVIFADNLAAVVQSGFSHPELLTGVDAWLVVYAFAFQIYFDFSGYTDIARGSAMLFGYKVPINFNLPYLAGSIAEFWHRWHISLSTWLRDYLYVPLGGSRCSRWLNYRNLFLTMLLGGLWHGAGTHFVAWGAFHGTALILHKAFKDATENMEALNILRSTKWFQVASVLLTFHVACTGWVLFRAENMDLACKMLRQMFFIDSSSAMHLTIVNIHEPVIFLLLPLVIVLLFAGQLFSGWLSTRKTPLMIPAPLRALGVAALILMLFVFSPDTSPKFIYFQF